MRQNNLKPAFIGKDGRTSAIQKCLSRSTRVVGEPVRLSEGKPEKADALRLAKHIKPDFVIIGPEVPLAEGIVDDLEGLGIPCIGPTRSLARLESSKAFTRQLLSKHNIPGNPEFRVFKSIEGVEAYLRELGDFVEIGRAHV